MKKKEKRIETGRRRKKRRGWEEVRKPGSSICSSAVKKKIQKINK